MQHQIIEYFDDKQKLIGELIYNDHIEPHLPGIILFHALEGKDAFIRQYAIKLAQEGFVVFTADIYGNGVVGTTLESCFELITPFLENRDIVRHRTLLAYQTFAQQPQIKGHKIAAVGFCFGGMCVLELARSGENIYAGVVMHGILRKSSLLTHPIKSKLLLLQGYQDPQVPPTELLKFAEEMETAGTKDWVFTFFNSAKHSFTDPKTATMNPTKEAEMGREYNRLAAERSFRYAVDFLKEL